MYIKGHFIVYFLIDMMTFIRFTDFFVRLFLIYCVDGHGRFCSSLPCIVMNNMAGHGTIF